MIKISKKRLLSKTLKKKRKLIPKEHLNTIILRSGPKKVLIQNISSKKKKKCTERRT